MLLLILLIGMWPLVWSTHSMKWDIVDITLPWNYYLTECINNGILPLWNPFINGGFAQMGLPDTWYPITWLLGFTFGMDLGTMHLDYLLHLFLGGLGMYTLLRQGGLPSAPAILLGTAYMFSGFTIGNAQHLGWVIGAAWLPWLFYYLRRLRQQPNWQLSLKLALVGFLMVSGGYPGISIISGYLALGYVIWHSRKRGRWLLYLGLSGFVFILLGMVVCVGALDLAPHINRGSALALSAEGWGALNGALPARALLSILTPFSTTVQPDFWGADLTLLNAYFGLLPLMFLLFANFRRKANRRLRLYTGLGLFFLCTALAEVFPFRAWLYHLPLFDLFRFPTLFRLFAIFFFLQAAAIGWQSWNQQLTEQRRFRWILYFMLIIFLALSIFGLADIGKPTWALWSQGDWSGWLSQLNWQGRMGSQALASSLFLIVFIKISKYKFQKRRINWLVLFGVFEILSAVQFNLKSTVITPQDPKIVDEALARLPRGFPLPRLDVGLSEVTEDAFRVLPYLHYNQNCYTKIPSAHGNSPYSFRSYRAAEANSQLSFFESPLVYLKHPTAQTNVQIQQFSPNHLQIQVESTAADTLFFTQNYYPHWKAYRNGQPIPIQQSKTTFMAIEILPGHQQIVFQFEPQNVIRAAWGSGLTLGLLCLILLIAFWQKSSRRGRWILGLALLWMAWNSRATQRQYLPEEARYQALATQLQQLPQHNSILWLANVDNPELLHTYLDPNIPFIPVRIQRKSDLQQLYTVLAESEATACYYFALNQLSNFPETIEIIRERFPKVQSQNQSSSAFLGYFQALPDRSRDIFTHSFERAHAFWSNGQLDSTRAKTGQWSELLHAEQEYGATFKYPLDSAKSPIKVNASTHFYKLSRRECLLVLQIMRNGQSVFWSGQNLTDYQASNREWQRALLSTDLPAVQAGDSLQIYFWNPGKDSVWIDDFKVEMRYEE